MGATGGFLCRCRGRGRRAARFFRLGDERSRQVNLEAERPNLQDVGIMQVRFFDSLAIDAGPHSAAAVANVKSVEAAGDNAVNAGDFWGIQLDVAASGLSESDAGPIERAMLLGRVAGLHEERGLSFIRPQVGFS